MKKAFLVFAMIYSASFCYAQKLDQSKVPADVKASFSKQYPGIAAKWNKEDDNYEANFNQDGNSMSVSFDSKGTMIETEIDIKIAALPAPILAYVKDHYKGKSIKEAAKITKADGSLNYEAEVDGKDVVFDGDGNFLKETKD